MVEINRRTFLMAAGVSGLAGSVFPYVGSRADGGLDPGRWAPVFHDALRQNPTLRGFRSVSAFSFEEASPKVEGKIPKGLNGSYYRIGPARHEIGDFRYHHWFDGDGLAQAYHFNEGSVRYRARMVETAKFAAEKAAGKPLRQGFGTAIKGMEPLGRPDTMNTANINLVSHGRELLALWEGGSAHVLDTESLKTLGLKTWSEDTGGMPFGAHPRRDQDGSLWNLGYASYAESFVIYHIAPDGTLKNLKIFSDPNGAMQHDFMITENHILVFLPPFHFERSNEGSILSAYKWRPEKGGRLGIIDKNLDGIQWIDTPPFFVFHFSNAYESAEEIHFEFMGYEDTKVFGDFSRIMRGDDLSLSLSGATIRKGRVNIKEQRVWFEPINSFTQSCEFPRISPVAETRRHERVTMLARSHNKAHGLFDQVVELEPDTGNNSTYWYGETEMAEEHIVLAAVKAGAPDLIIGPSFDYEADVSRLNIFISGALSQGPVARITLKQSIPLGLHGNFVPSPGSAYIG